MPVNYSSLITTVFGSFLASYLATDLLYTITNHTELWIFFFIILTFYIILGVMAYNYFYRDRHEKDLWYQSRHAFLLFIQMTFLLTVIRLFVDFLIYGISVNAMILADYINIFNIATFFIFVLLFKIQSLLVDIDQK